MLRQFLDRPDVTEICELRGRFGMMAFHGGNLERTTDVVADEVARRTGASLYAVTQSEPPREHLPSTQFDPLASDALASFLSFVDVVIAVHGYGRQELRNHLLVGGGNRQLARHVASHLREGLPEPYRVVDDLEDIPRALRGQHPENPVNLPAGRGAQLELPPTIRWNRKAGGWSDHQGVPRSPDVDHLIDALSAAVKSWAGEPSPASEQRGLVSGSGPVGHA